MGNEGRLDRADWVKAGLKTLAESGAVALKADPLARALNVSRGSFYWHFADVAAFHAAVLDAWESAATQAIITRVEAGGGEPRAKLHRLAQIVFSSDGSLERQLRAWASQDAQAAAAQERVDRRRIAYVSGLLGQTGFGAADADARARFFYLALVGQFATARRYALEGDELGRMVDLVIG